MGVKRYMVDSGGVTRHIRKRYAIDPGGVARLIKKRYIVDASGVTRLTFIMNLTFTMVAGQYDSPVGAPPLNLAGFATPVSGYPTSFGSIDNVSVPSGGSIATLADIKQGAFSTYHSLLQISGLSADPGAAYWSTLVINSLTRTSASASYGYNSGVATWEWSFGPSTLFGFVGGTSYPATLSFS